MGWALNLGSKFVMVGVAMGPMLALLCISLWPSGVFGTLGVPAAIVGASREPRRLFVYRRLHGEARETVSYYASQDWAEQFWHEFRLTRKQRYYPYVGWRRAPFKGRTIEIDQNGIRVTPGADCRAASFKVFTFGGSTMWGTGSP